MRLSNYHYLSYSLDDIKRFLPPFINLVNTNYFGFNMSAVPIPGSNLEIYSIRFAVKEKEVGTSDSYIVPGNSTTSQVFIGLHSNKREIPGKNFFWGRWMVKGFDCTLIFIGKYDGKKIVKFSPFLKLPYINHQYFNDKVKKVGTDHRLVNLNGKLYLYSRNMSYMIELDYELRTNKLGLGKLLLLNQDNRMTSDSNLHLNASTITSNGNDIFIIDIFDRSIEYKTEFSPLVMQSIKQKVPDHIFKQLKDYENNITVKKTEEKKDAVKIIKANPYSTDAIEENYACEYKLDPISMRGSSTAPMFSFGTPCIEIKKNKFLACGHLKIKQKYNVDIHTKEYEIDSSPYLVREYIHDTMHEVFNTNYVTHYGHNDGYIYMLYFYIIDTGDKGIIDIKNLDHVKIRMSDAFLPINLEKDQACEMKSSLYLAMSLFEKKINGKRMIHVTAGELDFHASIISLELSEILDACKHNVTHFKYSDFNYHFLPYFDGKSYDLTINYKEKNLEDEYCKKYSGLKEFLEKKSYPYKIEPVRRSVK